jgi:Fe2+ or Zn2+ uptake regulation protein
LRRLSGSLAAAARPRATRQLDATLRALTESSDHPSAERLFDIVRAELPAVSRGTVYRNLGKLVAAERVRVVHVHGRCSRFDARLDPHDHFVCTRCALLIDVERGDGVTKRVRGRVRGHRVDGRTLTYFGVCRGCESRR